MLPPNWRCSVDLDGRDLDDETFRRWWSLQDRWLQILTHRPPQPDWRYGLELQKLWVDLFQPTRESIERLDFRARQVCPDINRETLDFIQRLDDNYYTLCTSTIVNLYRYLHLEWNEFQLEIQRRRQLGILNINN